jgi:transcriptional regulator with XRE-family HTH domain
MHPPADPGELLKRHRERRGLSARKAAEAAGGNHVYWNQVERGVQRPPRRWLEEAARLVGAAPAQLEAALAALGIPPDRGGAG